VVVESEVGNFQQFCCFIVFNVALLFGALSYAGLEYLPWVQFIVWRILCMYVSGAFRCLQNLAESSFVTSSHLHGTTQLYWMDLDEI
jgi:hypothetical protein